MCWVNCLYFYSMVLEKFTIALIQPDIIWEDIDANLHQFSLKIQSVTNNVDLIVLPEMFTTGFTTNATELAEKMNEKTVCWMQKMAFKKQLAITGSIIISENEKFYNRLLFVYPSGEIKHYDKRHTFTLAKEHEVFSKGTERIIIGYKGFKICPLICYDLRFPVWARNTENYDLLLYVASWPKARITAWDTLLKARAIENMSFVVGVNRVGFDGNNFEYNGHSIVYDCLGNPLSKEKNIKEEIIIVELDKNYQQETRKRFSFLNDKDSFNLL